MIESVSEAVPPVAPFETDEQGNLRGLVFLGYVLLLVAGFTGIAAIIAVIVAYVKRGDAQGTIWRSHLDNLITVFWVMAAGVFIGILVWPLAIGALIAQFFFFWPWAWPSLGALPVFFGLILYPLLVLWFLYRMIRGLLQASADRPY